MSYVLIVSGKDVIIMKKIVIVLLVLMVSVFMATGAFASSSKTTAASGKVVVAPSITALGSCSPILNNTIRMANQSDLLIDVSIECGLVTRTRAKSKGGQEDSAAAAAQVKVYVEVDGEMASPGEVTFCRRAQELSAKFQGIFEGPTECATWDDVAQEWVFDLQCLAQNCLTISNGAIVIDEACLDYEEVELILDTMNANSFNFIATDVGVGDHDVTAYACTDSCTGDLVLNADGITYSCVDGEVDADATAIIGKGSMAVEEVKMIKEEDQIQ